MFSGSIQARLELTIFSVQLKALLLGILHYWLDCIARYVAVKVAKAYGLTKLGLFPTLKHIEMTIFKKFSVL